MVAYDAALRIAPDLADGWLGRGHALTDLARYDDALSAYEKALQLKPDLEAAYVGRGNVYLQTKRLAEALAQYEKALSLRPNAAIPRFSRGNVLYRMKRYDEALADYDAALSLDAGLADAWLGAANVHYQARHFEDAASRYDRALSLKPELADAWLGRGNVFNEAGRYDEALADYDRALTIKPDLAAAWLGRGNVFYELKRYDEANSAYDKALELAPDLASAWLGRGNLLSDLQRYDDALAAYDKALSLEPDLAAAYNSRGFLFHLMMKVDQAVADFNRAVAIRPNDAHARYNRSLELLLVGDFEQGWKEHEWRWKTKQQRSTIKQFSQPLWLGNESLAGKTILLYSEQGLGDSILFCRYAKLAAELGARVILEVQKPLLRVFSTLAGVTELIEAGNPLPAFDYQCPLMSLPLAFKTTLETIPNDVPYLRSDPGKSNYWKEKLGVRRRPRVGLVWSGGYRPTQPHLWRVNERRNVPLAKLAALKGVDVEFFSLQKGKLAEEELAELVSQNWDGPAIIDFTNELNDFADTAALMDNLDLIVTVDTSTAHLAGALGKPVWILVRFESDWRYLLERSDSLWYPTAKICRQARPNDWDDVVRCVRQDLLSKSI